MILTNCAACAAPLPPVSAKQCSRCKTRYCGPACQAQHWKEGGHDKVCKKINRGGGAEQYYAQNKYAAAVTVAVEKCAEDTKGQTCYICTEAVHWKTKEGLVRGCSSRGTAGFAHVSCLAEQGKILVVEAEENNSDDSQWRRWHMCSLCEQNYQGVVRCALGWACWKTYLGRPEDNRARRSAITQLGNGLLDAGHYENALFVQEAELSMERRLGASQGAILCVKANLATTYRAFERFSEALPLKRDVYSGCLKFYGEEHSNTIREASNYATTLLDLERFKEAKLLLLKIMPASRRVLGDSNEVTLKIRWVYAKALYEDDDATLENLREAVTMLEETGRTTRRVLGGAHTLTMANEHSLRESRAALRARETAPSDIS